MVTSSICSYGKIKYKTNGANFQQSLCDVILLIFDFSALHLLRLHLENCKNSAISVAVHAVGASAFMVESINYTAGVDIVRRRGFQRATVPAHLASF